MIANVIRKVGRPRNSHTRDRSRIRSSKVWWGLFTKCGRLFIKLNNAGLQYLTDSKRWNSNTVPHCCTSTGRWLKWGIRRSQISLKRPHLKSSSHYSIDPQTSALSTLKNGKPTNSTQQWSHDSWVHEPIIFSHIPLIFRYDWERCAFRISQSTNQPSIVCYTS